MTKEKKTYKIPSYSPIRRHRHLSFQPGRLIAIVHHLALDRERRSVWEGGIRGPADGGDA